MGIIVAALAFVCKRLVVAIVLVQFFCLTTAINSVVVEGFLARSGQGGWTVTKLRSRVLKSVTNCLSRRSSHRGSILEADIMTSTVTSPKQQAVSFSHVHLYVDKLQPLAYYKDLEGRLNEFADQTLAQGLVTLAEKRSLWESLVIDTPWAGRSPDNFAPHGRDVIEQLLAGFGFRVTAARMITRSSQVNTNTLLVTSRDALGVQFLITAPPSVDQITTPDDAMAFFDAGT